MSLYTGRPAGVLHEGNDASRWDFIQSTDAQYLALNTGGSSTQRHFVQLNGNRFEPVWSNYEFIVLRIRAPR